MKRYAIAALGAASLTALSASAFAQVYYAPDAYVTVYPNPYYEGRSALVPGHAPSDTPWASSNRINQTPSYAHPEGSGNPVVR
jgi:hypothetical protein